MPDVGIQIPPNLSDWWLPLVEEGATDLGGLSANGDHISPEHPFPSPHRMRKLLQPKGYALTERLCVYPQYMDAELARAGRARRDQAQVLELHPAARFGPPVGARDPPRPRRARDREGRATARGSTPEELTAMFAETRPEAIEDMRQAADELRARARRRRGDVRRQPQHQRLEHLRRRMRVLRLRPGQALARRLRARPRRVRAARAGGGRVRRNRDLHAVGHPSRLDDRGLRELAAAREGGRAGRSISTRTRRWRSTTSPATCRWTRRSRG